MSTNMLNIYLEGGSKPICKFEKFETGKAFDWVTSTGYCIVRKEYIPFMIWVVRKLP